MTKYERIVFLSCYILKQDLLQGHLKWKVTEISKSTRIARSLIYEFLGKNKKSILLSALECAMQEIYGLSQERMALRQNEDSMAGILRSRRLVMEAPELLSFYFKYRDRQNEVGKMIQSYEKKYLQLVAQQTGLKDPDRLIFIRTIIHGISVAPFLSEAQVKSCLLSMQKLI